MWRSKSPAKCDSFDTILEKISMFISPDLDEIIERSDRIAVFFGGRMSKIVRADETSVDELGHMIGGQV